MSKWTKTRLAHYDETTVPQDATRYVRANPFLMELRKHTKYLNDAQYKSLRRQALKGDIAGADRNLRSILGIM